MARQTIPRCGLCKLPATTRIRVRIAFDGHAPLVSCLVCRECVRAITDAIVSVSERLAR